MLERLYTTKMSSDKKILQKRFEKISFDKSRVSGKVTIFVTAVLVVTILCANVVMAMVDGRGNSQFKIEVSNGDNVIELVNKPFVKDNTVYLPLRELYEKIGIMSHEESFINWDNGRIYICSAENVGSPDAEYGSDIKKLLYYYGIEIGKAEYIFNPPEIVQKKYQFAYSPQAMEHAPVLKDGSTYIPFEFIEYVVNRTMTTYDISCRVWDLAYDDSMDREADFIDGKFSMEYFNAQNELKKSVEQYIRQYVVRPCDGLVSASFGKRTHPVTGAVSEHNGVDIAVPVGTETVSAVNGTVTDTGYNADDGHYIVISSYDMEYDIVTVYKHLDSISAKKGQEVLKGDVVALSGNSGKSTGPHLHFEIKVGDMYYNPSLIY